MNETMNEATTEQVFRRLEEPFKLFNWVLPPLAWGIVLLIVLAIGLVYIVLMYKRDSKGIGVGWAIFLGTLRLAVYVGLAFVFLMPAEQTWYETRQRSKVILLWDVSLSMSTTRDDLPGPTQKYDDMPTRMDKVLALLGNQEVKFLDRLQEKNPITAYRFSRSLDNDYRYFDSGKFWPRSEREKLLAALSKKDKLPPGYAPEADHWKSFLTPLVNETKLPEGWLESEERTQEFIRQLRENQAKVSSRFYEATAIGESLLEVIKQERNNMVNGIVVFTDGRVTEGSLSAVREAVLAANDAEIPVFVVQVGETRPKVAIDIVDIGAPPLIRPEDKWRVVVTVNGQDMQPNVDGFDIFLDVTRIKRKPNAKDVEEIPLELVELDEKGAVLADKKIPLGKKKITLTAKDAKEKPVFKQGTPPTCQVEFELDAAKLAAAAGVSIEGKKVGLAPDDASEIRFVVRIPKDKREIFDKAEHISDAADMRVEEKALRVLLVTSAATRDYQFVRTLLVREEQKNRAKLCIHLQNIPDAERRDGIVQDVEAERMLKSFPVKRTLQKGDTEPFYSMASYDVIVAFDVNWKDLSVEQADMLSEWVYRKGGGLIFIAGQMNTKETASPLHKPRQGSDLSKKPYENPFRYITEMLPVELEFTDKDDPRTDVPQRLEFPQATADMEFMRIDETMPKEKWLDGWKKFFNEIQDDDGNPVDALSKKDNEEPERGIYYYYPTKKVKDNALRIATIDSPTALLTGGKPGEKQPFLAMGPWGEGKVIYLASEDTWRLRMYKEQYHERFWTKLLREAGSKSANTLNKRITPIMSRYGTVNKYQPFEARFEDLNSQPLRRDVKLKPKLTVTPPEGVAPEKDNTVVIREVSKGAEKLSQYLGREARITKVENKRDVAGSAYRELSLTIFTSPDRKQTASEVVDERQLKLEILYEPLLFKPRLGEARPGEKDEDLKNKNNDGWFKVEFQPRTAGEYKLRVAYEDSPDNVYNHKFVVKESNPETDNVKPDPEVLWELASPAKKVLARMESAKAKEEVRKLLLKKPEDAKAAAAGQGKKPEGQDDETSRLLFDLKGAEYIPDCMKTDKKDIRNRGKVDDLWDDGFFEVETESGEKKPLLPHVLWIAVGLLSVEWLTRKLLRLA